MFRITGYAKTHYWNPPVDLDSEVWKYMNLKAEEAEVSWAVFDREEIVICSDTRIFGEVTVLGWAWHNDKYEISGSINTLWEHILMRQLLYCQEHGRNLLGEFDSTDLYGQYKSRLLKRSTEETCFIYQQQPREQSQR